MQGASELAVLPLDALRARHALVASAAVEHLLINGRPDTLAPLWSALLAEANARLAYLDDTFEQASTSEGGSCMG